ncbi:hypothetical protein Dimus_008371, partial [Dionaea muscipula]
RGYSLPRRLALVDVALVLGVSDSRTRRLGRSSLQYQTQTVLAMSSFTKRNSWECRKMRLTNKDRPHADSEEVAALFKPCNCLSTLYKNWPTHHDNRLSFKLTYLCQS